MRANGSLHILAENAITTASMYSEIRRGSFRPMIKSQIALMRKEGENLVQSAFYEYVIPKRSSAAFSFKNEE